MPEDEHAYDLEERTFEFALAVRRCASEQKWNPAQWTDVNQLLRSSGSIAANYTEANNAVSRPDFLHKIASPERKPPRANSGSASSAQPPRNPL